VYYNINIHVAEQQYHTYTHTRRSRMTALILTADKISLNISSWFKRLTDALEHRAQVRNTIKELNKLSDYELHDIGLHRSMINYIAEGGSIRD
jgi:uncharacterized protein YjiS (DUF1127 family)